MRLLRALVLVTGTAGCANIFGFQDLEVADGGNDAMPLGDTSIADAVSEDVALPLVCDGGPILPCNGQCVDIRSNSANCGACGHDCGGGTCASSVCQPALVVDSLTNPVFDVDTTRVYYSSGSKVLACPLAGCTAPPAQLEDSMTIVYGSDTPGTGILRVNQGHFFFVADPVQNTSRPTLFACPIAGCPTSPTLLRNCGLTGGFNGATKGPSTVDWVCYRDFQYTSCADDGGCSPAPGSLFYSFSSGFVSVLPMASDVNGVYFVNPQTTQLLHCANAMSCPTPDVLLGSTSGVTQLAVYANVIYMLVPGAQGGIPGGQILTCPTTGTCSTGLFAKSLPNPLYIAADATGVYWFDHDSPLSSTVTGQITTCPISGCVGGPRSLAQMQTGTTALVTDPSFVYWATATQIWRVAK